MQVCLFNTMIISWKANRGCNWKKILKNFIWKENKLKDIISKKKEEEKVKKLLFFTIHINNEGYGDHR